MSAVKRFVFLALALCAGPAFATEVRARFTEPTTRYSHGVLGDAIEWGALEITTSRGRRVTHRLPQARVFEDTAPRVVVAPSGEVFVVVVESSLRYGARLSLFTVDGALHAATPFIGQPNRWLAPVAAADLDGDGALELAYIDRPHLRQTLRVWRLTGSTLTEVASQGGLSNHRIGERHITSGVRYCGAEGGMKGAEMIIPNADRTLLMAVRLTAGGLETKPLGPYTGPRSLEDALRCSSG